MALQAHIDCGFGREVQTIQVVQIPNIQHTHQARADGVCGLPLHVWHGKRRRRAREKLQLDSANSLREGVWDHTGTCKLIQIEIDTGFGSLQQTSVNTPISAVDSESDWDSMKPFSTQNEHT